MSYPNHIPVLSVLNLCCQQVFIEIDDDGSETITSAELEAGCLFRDGIVLYFLNIDGDLQ